MKWCILLALAACQHAGKEAAAVDPAYRDDIVTLCDCEHLSGADQMPDNERWPVIAMWLGPHLKTEAAHAFLVQIQPLTGEPKARALEGEAKRVGLGGCALAARWHVHG